MHVLLFSTQEKRAGRQLLLAEHHEFIPVPELSSPKPHWHPNKQHKVALCSERFSKPGDITAGMLFTFSAAVWGQQRSPQLASLPTVQAGSKCAGVGFFLHHLRLYMLILAPNARGKLSSCRALYGQEELGLLNKQLFNILFSLHCSMRGLKPRPALNTELVLSLQAFWQAHREQWLGSSQVHSLACILTLQTGS